LVASLPTLASSPGPRGVKLFSVSAKLNLPDPYYAKKLPANVQFDDRQN
jgi:hypothetical protein